MRGQIHFDALNGGVHLKRIAGEVGGATAVDCSVGVGYSFHKFDVRLQQILRTSILEDPATALVATSRTIVSVSRSLSVQ